MSIYILKSMLALVFIRSDNVQKFEVLLF